MYGEGISELQPLVLRRDSIAGRTLYSRLPHTVPTSSCCKCRFSFRRLGPHNIVGGCVDTPAWCQDTFYDVLMSPLSSRTHDKDRTIPRSESGSVGASCSQTEALLPPRLESRLVSPVLQPSGERHLLRFNHLQYPTTRPNEDHQLLLASVAAVDRPCLGGGAGFTSAT
jgi:hypothetical protein